tara:strand:+ start:69 stop:287 length:219 start_codon:yes stop_codon:yes gene_type:complete
MAGNTEIFLFRLSHLVEKRYNDKNLAEYIRKLNGIFIENNCPDGKIDELVGEVNYGFLEKYLKGKDVDEWSY